MKTHRLILTPRHAVMAGFLTAGVQPVYADAVLPIVTVNPPRPPLAEIINNPQVLEPEDLTIAHERSIADAIEGLPGLNSIKAGGYGQPAALFVRGAGGQGLVTLDDVPLLLSLPGLLNLDTFPVEALQGAEIERGPGAVQHPFQAVGGSVRLYTRDRKDTGASLSVEGGTFATLRETVQGSIAGAPGRATLTLSRGDTFDGTHASVADDNPERDPFRFSQGILRFSSDLGTRLNWQGSALYRKSRIGLDTLGFDRSRRAFKDDSGSFARGDSWLAQTSLNARLSPTWSSRMQLGFTQLTSTVRLENLPRVGTLQTDLNTRMYLAAMHHQHTLIDDQTRKLRWQLNWGGQGRHEQAEAEPRAFTRERTMAAGYLESAAQYRSLSGSAGVRVERFDGFGDHPLFKAAAAWRIAPEFTLRASGGTGYRIPSYTELLSLLFGNLNLKPERSASGDAGLDWRLNEDLRLAVNGYYHRYDDLIIQAYHPLAGPVTLNVPDASVAGIELDLRYAWTQHLDTGFSYTFSDAQNLDAGRLLPLRPPHTARIWGEQRLTAAPVTLWAEAIVRSSTWNDVANQIPVDSSLQLNAAVRYAISDRFEIYLRGENLTNNRAPRFYSIDMPGTAVYGGFKVEL